MKFSNFVRWKIKRPSLSSRKKAKKKERQDGTTKSKRLCWSIIIIAIIYLQHLLKQNPEDTVCNHFYGKLKLIITSSIQLNR